MNRVCRPPKPTSSPRAGFLITEALVAAIVLVAVISVLAQLTVRSGRLQMESRHYRLALDELSNQLDRLIALEENARNKAIENLQPSPTIQAALGMPQLTAKLLTDPNGRRLVISLAWDRPGGRQPETLVGWLPPLAANAQETSL